MRFVEVFAGPGFVATLAIWSGYALIGVELLFLPIPSEASTLAVVRGLSGRPLRGVALVFSWVIVMTLYGLPIVWTILPLLGAGPAHLRVTPRGPVTFAGIALGLLGSGLCLAATIGLWRSHGRLKTGGLFSLSRNPMLMSLYVMWVGWILLFRSWLLCALFVAYALHMHHRIRLEERSLAQRFGAAYQSYRQRVGRYVGLGRPAGRGHKGRP